MTSLCQLLWDSAKGWSRTSSSSCLPFITGDNLQFAIGSKKKRENNLYKPAQRPQPPDPTPQPATVFHPHSSPISSPKAPRPSSPAVWCYPTSRSVAAGKLWESEDLVQGHLVKNPAAETGKAAHQKGVNFFMDHHPWRFRKTKNCMIL